MPCGARGGNDKGKSPTIHNKQGKGTHIVRVLDEHILALLLFPDQVDDGPDNAPAVGERHVHLARKVGRLVRLDADDRVALRVARVGTCNVTVASAPGVIVRIVRPMPACPVTKAEGSLPPARPMHLASDRRPTSTDPGCARFHIAMQWTDNPYDHVDK